MKGHIKYLFSTWPLFFTTACATGGGDPYGMDSSVDWTWEPDTGWIEVPDAPEDTPVDTSIDQATDTVLDTLPDPEIDTAIEPASDPLVDDAPDTVDGPGPCGGKPVGGYCWYLGDEEQTCTAACAAHGGYSEATRTFAGSDGTNWNCNDVLDALDAAGVSTNTLSASGAGVGCFLMNLVNDRYRVADTPTISDATYMLARRACACNE